MTKIKSEIGHPYVSRAKFKMNSRSKYKAFNYKTSRRNRRNSQWPRVRQSSFAFLGKETWIIKDILIKKENKNQENIWKTHPDKELLHKIYI